MEEFIFGYFLGLGVMRDEDDFDVFVARAQKSIEEKKEAPRQVFLHRVHGARGVHDAEDHGVRLAAGLRYGMVVAQVILVKRESLAMQGGDVSTLGGFLPFYPGTCGSFLV